MFFTVFPAIINMLFFILLGGSDVPMFDNFQQVNRFLADRKQFGIKPGLDRMYKLLRLLGQPQNKSSAIHIAGTNGKGSTIHYLKNALAANGYRVGVFTSPSLNGITGYIWLNNIPIPEHLFIELLDEMYPAIQSLDQADNHPTEFEIITALAFFYFADRVDIALIEAGMGGREDTTNCFLPLFSIITNVAHDHTAFLGRTIKSIAGHKAGIIKEQKPVIIGEMPPEALIEIQREAEQRKAAVYQFGYDFWISSSNETGQATSLSFIWLDEGEEKIFDLAMNGDHQRQNAALSVMALSLLERNHYRIDWNKAAKGVAQTQVPGRFERIMEHPPIVIDGAHNVAGIQSFIRTMRQYYPESKRYLLFAGFGDKALTQMLQELIPYFTSITLTTFDHPRAMDAEQLYQLIGRRDIFSVNEDWHAFIRKHIAVEPAGGSILFVTGSLNFIFDVRNYLTGHFLS